MQGGKDGDAKASCAGDPELSATCRSARDGPAARSLADRVVANGRLAGLFVGWYGFNVLFNILNKQVLTVFHFPFTCTTMQFFVGSLIVTSTWILQVYPLPRAPSRESLPRLLSLAVVHTIGNFLTNVSLGRVSVSFTHTIKALEPLFTVMLSFVFLGQRPTRYVMASLATVITGVVCSTMHEPSFNWTGFLCAMGSNLTFQSRNVLSKIMMTAKSEEDAMDNIALFSVITLLSFCLSLPVTIAMEGSNVLQQAIHTAPVEIIYAGLCFHAYQQISYVILQTVAPVTHAVGNCFKRVVIILVSVMFFGNHVGLLNSLGIATALIGVYAYTRCKMASSTPVEPQARAPGKEDQTNDSETEPLISDTGSQQSL